MKFPNPRVAAAAVQRKAKRKSRLQPDHLAAGRLKVPVAMRVIRKKSQLLSAHLAAHQLKIPAVEILLKSLKAQQNRVAVLRLKALVADNLKMVNLEEKGEFHICPD